MKLEDPTTTFEANHAFLELMEEQLMGPLKVKMWELLIKKYLSREWKLRGNVHKLYAIFLGQCTQALRSTLKGDPEYEEKSERFNLLWFINRIKN